MKDTTNHPNNIYVLRNDIAIEDFDDGTLLFQASDRQMISANKITRHILSTLDGTRTLKEISALLVTEYHVPEQEIEEDIAEILANLESRRIIKQMHQAPLSIKRDIMNENTQYLANPDVSCRIEDDDGAILYNPDDETVQVLNPIGLEIWETLSTPHTKEGLIDHLRSKCDNLPEEEVAKDVDDFMARLNAGGYIGEIEDKNDNQ